LGETRGLLRAGYAFSFFSLIQCFEDIPSATRRSSSFVVSAWHGMGGWVGTMAFGVFEI
jgi:uncharacterized membrane protein